MCAGLTFTENWRCNSKSWNSSRYDSRNSKNQYFKAISKGIIAAQKNKRKIVEINFLHFWMPTNPKPK